MSKISREDNKKRFKTGMYPTQQDFENVFDSYVHKDDTIDPSKIVSGDENIVDIINRKAEERHNHPISEVDNLSETLQQIQDDLDTAEDNIAGHETRIVTLEAAKTDYEAFKERVRAFLEDANASDTTIDRWHEIENFLQGITDTETLTGLLNDLKQEILREIPEPQTGNYLEQVSDMSAKLQTATDGQIVQYVGQTTEEYTRGFCYEKVEGASYPQNVEALELQGALTSYGRSLGVTRSEIDPTDNYDVSQITDRIFLRDGSLTLPRTGQILLYMGDKESPEVGDTIMPCSMFDGDVFRKVKSVGEGITANNISFGSTTSIPVFVNGDGIKIWSVYYFSDQVALPVQTNNIAIGVLLPDGRAYYVEVEKGVHYPSYNKPAKKSWQHIPVSPVIY